MHVILKVLLIIVSAVATIYVALGFPALIGWVLEGPGLFARFLGVVYIGSILGGVMAVVQSVRNNFMQVPGYAFFLLCIPGVRLKLGSMAFEFPWVRPPAFEFRHDLTPGNPDYIAINLLAWALFFLISSMAYGSLRTMRPWHKNYKDTQGPRA